MLLKKTILLAALIGTAACHTTTGQHPERANNEDSIALAAFTSQAMLMAGGPVGLAFFPLLVAADVHSANTAMASGENRATLEDTYRFVYNRDLDSVGPSGNTGMLFRDLNSATRYFRTVLDGHGVARSQDFTLTAVRTADTEGYTLYALVHRPYASIQIRDANNRIRTITQRDAAWYRPYRTDAFGRPVDVVVDWAGVQRRDISHQKGQAILLTLAANSVLLNRRSDEFWGMERRWLAGQYRQVVAERRSEIERRMAQR